MRRLVRACILLVLVSLSAPRLAAETAELVADIDFSGGAPGSSPEGLIPVSRSGAAAVFSACDGVERRVWRSDGTETGTFALPGAGIPCASPDRPRPLASAGIGFYLARSASGKLQLWRTDGTVAGTFRVSPDRIGSIREVAAFGEGVAFLADDKLYLSDGSLLGTHPFMSIPVDALEPRFLRGFGSRLFFVARQSGATANEQLWVTDGTEPGTLALTDFHSSAFDPETPPEMAATVGATVFFVAEDRLWKTDGTAGGTAPVLASLASGAFPGSLAVFKNTLYFVAGTDRGTVGRGLWRSDGTVAGTFPVLLVGTPAGVPAWLTVLGDRLFFAADDGAHGIELWRSDGTELGTSLVRDIAPGVASAGPAWLAAAGGRVFFAAQDGASGIELWESDGTSAGTRRVHDIAPGVASSNPQELTLAGNHLFFAADDGVHGEEPWALDLSGGGGCVPSAQVLCLSGGRFRVVADWHALGSRGDGHAVSLTGDTGYFWFFNAANVEVVLKVLDGRGVNGHHWVFYGALSNVEYALTVTDTETGAVRRYENPAGRLASVADTEAFRRFSGPGVGEEAPEPTVEETEEEAIVASWAEAVTGSCAPSSTRLCLNGGRFAVEARWKDFSGNTGAGQAISLSGGDTGYFWFFNPSNVEVVLKVLDGRPLNGKFWVFYGALSSVEYTLTVTDTETGAVKTYTNPSGRLASVADTGAF